MSERWHLHTGEALAWLIGPAVVGSWLMIQSGRRLVVLPILLGLAELWLGGFGIWLGIRFDGVLSDRQWWILFALQALGITALLSGLALLLTTPARMRDLASEVDTHGAVQTTREKDIPRQLLACALTAAAIGFLLFLLV